MKDGRKKQTLMLVIIILILLLLGGGFLFTRMNKNSQLEGLDTNAENSINIEIEQGEKVTWEAERKEFYIPKGWTYSFTQDSMLQGIDITGDEVALQMRYLPVEDDYVWSKQENIEYQNSSSRLYIEEGEYKAALNLSIELTEQNYETGESTMQEYALFVLILKNGQGATELSPEEKASVVYLLDEFAK